MDVAQTALLLIGWTVAFLLGKELQSGFAQWQATRRRQPISSDAFTRE